MPFTTTNVRLWLWLLMAAPFLFVRVSPFRRISCFLVLYNLKNPSPEVPESS